MTNLKHILNSRYFFWIILSIPSLPMLWDLVQRSGGYDGLMHASGEFSTRFLVITLLITPLMYLTNGAGWIRWVLRRRRYLGLAAFGYSLLHTIFYLREMNSMAKIWSDLTDFGISTGWIAFLIFVPLALTSNDKSVQRMGPSWKTLQRFSYLAALFTALHWAIIGHIAPVFVHFVPVVIGIGYTFWRKRSKANSRVAS